MRRLSLSSRLALLFAACTAVVSLFAGVLFNRASEQHFVELDQQLLDLNASPGGAADLLAACLFIDCLEPALGDETSNV